MDKERQKKEITEQIFEETINLIKNQDGFNEELVEQLKQAYAKGEFKKSENIIKYIKPKAGN